MNFEESKQTSYEPDQAAIFACAMSLWEECRAHEKTEPSLDLSWCYDGLIGLMQEVMRIAHQFERWACVHVHFDNFAEVWPYMLGDKFGTACLQVLGPDELRRFDERHCLRVAMQLRVPIKLSDDLPVPIDVRAPNPISNSLFRHFRIQTVRDCIEENASVPFSADDDPFDPKFSVPYFGVYGVDVNGLSEHIADRATYANALSLVQKLAPGIKLPVAPTLLSEA